METQQQDFNQVKQSIPYNAVQDAPNDERLSAFELGQLWEGYMADSSAGCLLQYFVASAQDPEIRSVLEYALQLTTYHMNAYAQMFNSVGFPIPIGFTSEDVKPQVKRLFSDGYMLAYLRYINRYGAIKYFNTLIGSSRQDVRQFANQCIDEVQNLHKKADEILIKKGFFSEEAHMPVPDRVEYVYDGQSFYKGLFGNKRPINCLEIAQVFSCLEAKLHEKPIITGFMQVTQSQKVKDLFNQCKDVIGKQVNRWTQLLRDEDLPLPMSLVHELTDSSESPFSDKLMMFHVLTVIGYSLTGYGVAIASCTRADIVAAMHKSLTENAAWAKKAMELMMQSGWMEKVPHAADRKEIIGFKQ
jgi:spore coat protein CotF